MKKIIINFFVIFIVLSATYVSYSYGRYERQKELDLQLELINYSVWATKIKMDLGLLEMLNEHKISEAKNKIEIYIDVTLASLGNYEKLAKKYPDPEIFEAIKRAKQYRQQTNTHKVPIKLSTGVEQAFRIVE
jgi:hypothetical protein